MTQLDEQSGTEVVSPWETPERRALTDLVQAFTRKEIVPYVTEWEEAGELPRELHRSAARAGLLGIGFAEDVGGAGGDLREAVREELGEAGDCAFAESVYIDEVSIL